MRRREFLGVVGSAATAWPVATRAQQPMPVIGFLHPSSSGAIADRVRAFRGGLKEVGFVDGENVVIEYRWAEDQVDRMPALAAELVRRNVAVISAVGGNVPVFAAKAATTTIPIVFAVGEDPVRLGLVASLGRPGGNLTGINFLTSELAAKQLELLRELVPAAVRVAVLVNPANTVNAETTMRDVEPAARDMGVKIQIVRASNNREIDAAFEGLARERPDALLVGGDPFFTSRRIQVVLQATRHAIAAIFANREIAEAGGLMSYGSSFSDTFRQVGVYTGRILKGAKPMDMPVVQSTKFELIINMQAAKILGLTVPPALLARADEVIE